MSGPEAPHGATIERQLRAAKEFVETWGELACSLPGDYDCQMTCTEADAICALFTAFGHTDTASDILRYHAETDEPGEGHFIGPLPEGWNDV